MSARFRCAEGNEAALQCHCKKGAPAGISYAFNATNEFVGMHLVYARTAALFGALRRARVARRRQSAVLPWRGQNHWS